MESIDKEARTVTFALASETPVQRWYGAEILDHAPKSVRQDRLKRGIAMLFGHNTNQHIGRIDSYEIKDGVLRVTARFGNSPLAEEKFRDVQDGILVDASVGYIVHEYQLESQNADTGACVYRVTDWEPVEGSLVPIPADPTVGVGRSIPKGTPVFPARCLTARAEDEDEDDCGCSCAECAAGDCANCSNDDCDDSNCRCAEGRSLPATNPEPATAAPSSQEVRSIMEPTATAGAPASNHNEAVMAERARVSEINALAARYPKQITREKAEEFVGNSTAAADVRKFILDSQIDNAKANEVRNLNIAGLSESEKAEYSIVRALNQAAMGERCFELEVHEELVRKLGRESRASGNQGGIFIPMDIKMKASDNERGLRLQGMAQRAGLDATAGATGGSTVFTEYVSLIELLRNKMKVRALGATVLSGLRDTIAFPKQATAGTATWVADNPGADVADSNLTFAQISLAPKLIQSSTGFSRKLLLQSSVDVEALVRNDLTAITALAIDLAALAGTGANNQPLGIFNQVGVGSVATAGATLTKSFLVDMETAVSDANADELGPMAYLMTPKMRGKLKKTAELGNTIALPIFYKGEVNDYRAEVSKQVPTFAIGGGTPYTAQGIVFGAWNQLLIGEWGALEVIVDPYRLKKQGMIEVTTFDTCDVNVRHPEAFCVCADANIAA